MNTTPFSLDQLSAAGTVKVELPADVAGMLRSEAKAARRPVAKLVREWLEERAEDRAAEQALREAIKVNRGHAARPAEDVFRECGL